MLGRLIRNSIPLQVWCARCLNLVTDSPRWISSCCILVTLNLDLDLFWRPLIPPLFCQSWRRAVAKPPDDLICTGSKGSLARPDLERAAVPSSISCLTTST
jgi:hypothetical protein